MNILDTAIHIAKHSFANKTDRAGKPYFDHCVRVMESIKNKHTAISDEVLCIAILHDLLEDCPEWNPISLKCFFNDRIVDAIVALTWKDNTRYADYIDQVSQNTDAALVKIHDLKDNMDITRLEKLTDSDLKRLNRYHKAYMTLINS